MDGLIARIFGHFGRFITLEFKHCVIKRNIGKKIAYTSKRKLWEMKRKEKKKRNIGKKIAYTSKHKLWEMKRKKEKKKRKIAFSKL